MSMDSIVNAVQQRYRDLQIAHEDVSSSAYSIREEFVRPKAIKDYFIADSSVGWRATAIASIHVKAIRMVDTLISALSLVRGVTINQVYFHVDSVERVLDSLRAEACANALMRANVMVAPLGGTVGAPLVVTDGQIQVVNGTQTSYGQPSSFIVRGSRTSTSDVLVDGLAIADQFVGGLGGSAMEMSSGSNTLTPGLFRFSRTCVIQFEIR
jgi:hypothetical protein